MTGMIAWIAFSSLLALALGAFLVGSFFDPAVARSAGYAGSSFPQSLNDSKERALRALKDLELDYSMGKVSREDFERSKHELSLEVASILDEIGEHEERR